MKTSSLGMSFYHINLDDPTLGMDYIEIEQAALLISLLGLVNISEQSGLSEVEDWKWNFNSELLVHQMG